MSYNRLRRVVRRLKGVVGVRPTYVLFSLETQSPKGHLNICMGIVLSRSSVQWKGLLEVFKLDIFNLL